MDKKDIIRGVLLAVVLVAAWVGLKVYWQHAHPEWFLPAPEPSPQVDRNPSTQPTTAAAATQFAAGTTTTTQSSTTQPSVAGAHPTTTGASVATSGPSLQPGFAVDQPTSAEQVRPVRIGSDVADDPKWPMQLS